MDGSAASYDAWYDTPRGRWIGATEFRLVSKHLSPHPENTVLDVGCGSGYFTRCFSKMVNSGNITGLDADPSMVEFARSRDRESRYIVADAQNLPFHDNAFDSVVSVAALCFMDNERRALSEMLRVTRSRFVVAWLNRASLLYRQQGRNGGSGGYRGARWHNAAEVRDLFAGIPVQNLVLASAVFMPSGTVIARAVERMLPASLYYGSVLVASGEILL